MRESVISFSAGFTTGLRPEEHVRTQAEHLMTCLNLVPTQLGLQPRPDVDNPVKECPEDTFPFPALYVLSRHILLFTSTALYLVDGDWELSHLYDMEWGGLPHVADFMDTVVFSTPAGEWSFIDGAIVESVNGATFKVCHNYRGQLVVGDCDIPKGPARDEAEKTVVQEQVEVKGENLVAWSKIGSIEWGFSLGNEVGYAPMPWNGKVLGLLTLDKDIVVYGDNGIAKLSPQSNPVATFGIEKFGDIGVLNRDCFAGDDQMHVFVGADRNLYAITPKMALSSSGHAPTRLGYHEWLKDMVDPVVSFDPQLRQWWIADARFCYIYSGSGLGSCSVSPTHLSSLDGRLLGITYRHHLPWAVAITGDVTLGHRGIKTLGFVESDVLASGKVHGFVHFRYAYDKPMRKTPEILLDPRGAFFPSVAGTELRVGFQCGDFHGFSLTNLRLHFKNTDKTFSRGVMNAGSASG